MSPPISAAGSVIWPKVFSVLHNSEQMIAIPEAILIAILNSVGGRITIDNYDYMYATGRSNVLIEQCRDPFMWILSLEKK